MLPVEQGRVAPGAKLDPGSIKKQDPGSKIGLRPRALTEEGRAEVADHPEEVQKFLEAIKALEGIEDDAACAAAITKILKDWPDSHARLREIRQERVLRMKAQGKTWQEIGDRLGIHFTRAQQIAKGLRGAKRPKAKGVE